MIKFFVEKFFADLDLDNLISAINLLYLCYKNNDVEVSWFASLCNRALNISISEQLEDTDISNYCENYDINALVYDNVKTYYYKDHEETEVEREVITNKL